MDNQNTELTMDISKAKTNETKGKSGRIGNIRNKKVMQKSYTVMDAENPTDKYGYAKEFINVRIYMAARSDGASPVYALMWCNGIDQAEKQSAYFVGVGSAGGYGYDKTSAAIDSAFMDCGITGYKHFGGVGDSGVEKALKLLAIALGAKKPFITQSFG